VCIFGFFDVTFIACIGPREPLISKNEVINNLGKSLKYPKRHEYTAVAVALAASTAAEADAKGSVEGRAIN
jgi:hypothetical protein